MDHERHPGSEQARDEPPTHGFDTAEALRAVDDALKTALLRYAEVLPLAVITMGKIALHEKGKVMAWRLADERGADAQTPFAKWPLFVLAGYRAALPEQERHTWRRALPCAVAVELAVAAADLIDEVTDGDPSVVGSEYGLGQALNTGNLMLVMAQQVLARHALESGDAAALQALDTLQEMLVEAAVGQYLDMAYEAMGPREVTPEMSGAMTDHKAGALMGGAFRMGALMALGDAGSDGDNEVVELLHRFGRQLGGMAQLANDIQDVLPANTVATTEQGEQVALGAPKTDILRRKRTIPIVFALRDDSPEPNAVQQVFAAPPGSPPTHDEDALRHAVVQAGGVNFANLVMNVYRGNAEEAKDRIDEIRPGAAAILGFFLG